MPDESVLLTRLRPQAALSAPLSERFSRKAVFSRLERIGAGQLTIIDHAGTHVFGPASATLRATIVVDDPSFYRDVVSGGSLAVGESYVTGKWQSPDIYNVFRLFARDRQALSAVDGGLAQAAAPLLAAWEWIRRNSKTGSKKNIVAHYDLGNDFYRLMLDETMSYSCAMFGPETRTLAEASLAKNDHVCRKLGLVPGDHVLEIGTGWGGLAMHAVRHYGCRVTTTTISDAQYDYAVQRIREAGLQDRITVLNHDYRDLEGQFNKIVSIEMIEAVGHQYIDTYFEQLDRLLTDDGQVLIQAIVLNDDQYRDHVRSVDFIQKYIFPGSTIPSQSVLLSAAARCRDMRLFDMEDITDSYAPTLLAWRERFLANLAQVRAQGFSERFIRMWDFYLCYVAAGFAERYLGDVHLQFARQAARPQPVRLLQQPEQRRVA